MLKREELRKWATTAHTRDALAQQVRVQSLMEQAADSGQFWITVKEPLLNETRNWLEKYGYTISAVLDTSFGVSWG